MLNRIKTALSRPLVDWVERAPDDRVYAERFNRLQPYRAHVRIRVECDEDRSLLRIRDGNESIWISRRSRLPHQIGGLSKRRLQLQQDYLVPDGLVRSGDLVIDCGANVGEFAIICARAGAHVLAFEPDPREFAALAANSQLYTEIVPLNYALWNKAGSLPFYNKNRTGDSSLLDPGDSEGVIHVEAIRLDRLQHARLQDSRIRLLKVEAEGGEPEVLEGCGDILSRVDYITADLGPERGLEKKTTVAPVVNMLYDIGFRLIDFSQKRCAALFEALNARSA